MSETAPTDDFPTEPGLYFARLKNTENGYPYLLQIIGEAPFIQYRLLPLKPLTFVVDFRSPFEALCPEPGDFYDIHKIECPGYVASPWS